MSNPNKIVSGSGHIGKSASTITAPSLDLTNTQYFASCINKAKKKIPPFVLDPKTTSQSINIESVTIENTDIEAEKKAIEIYENNLKGYNLTIPIPIKDTMLWSLSDNDQLQLIENYQNYLKEYYEYQQKIINCKIDSFEIQSEPLNDLFVEYADKHITFISNYNLNISNNDQDDRLGTVTFMECFEIIHTDDSQTNDSEDNITLTISQVEININFWLVGNESTKLINYRLHG